MSFTAEDFGTMVFSEHVMAERLPARDGAVLTKNRR